MISFHKIFYLYKYTKYYLVIDIQSLNFQLPKNIISLKLKNNL